MAAAVKKALGASMTVVTPEEKEAYAASRNEFFNDDMVQKKPAVFIYPTTAAQVADAVKAVVAAKLPLRVTNAGAHSPHCSADGAAVINLRKMTAVTVDAAARRVRAEGGCQLGHVDDATAPHGLAVPAGTVSDTGLMGLALGGGNGYLVKEAGFTCENIVEYEVVLADGSSKKVSATENADLYFGMRGAGFSFGVVTAATFKAYPVTKVFTGPLIFPFPMGKKVMQTYREWSVKHRSNPHVAGILAIGKGPDGSNIVIFMPLLRGAYGEDEAKAKACVQAFLDLGPVVNGFHPDTYCNAQKQIDHLAPRGKGGYDNGPWFKEMTDAVIDVFLDGYAALPECADPGSVIVIEEMTELHPPPDDQRGVVRRNGMNYWPALIGVWAPDKRDTARDPVIQWCRTTADALRKAGADGGFSTVHNDGDKIDDFYSADSLARLAALKAKYDPNNVFRAKLFK